LVFENATAGRNTGCRSVVNCASRTAHQLTPPSRHGGWWDGGGNQQFYNPSALAKSLTFWSRNFTFKF